MGQSKKRSAYRTRRPAPPRRTSRLPARAAVILVGTGIAAGVWAWRAVAQRPPAVRSERASAAVTPAVGTESEEHRLVGLVARQPTDPGARVALARHYTAESRPAEAVWEYQEAAALGPDDPSVQIAAANAWGGLRLPEVAIEQLRILVVRHPHAGEARLRLAEQLLATGRAEPAVALLLPLARDPGASPEALRTLGKAQWVVGDLKAARAAFGESARRQPEGAEGDYWQGRVAWASGHVDDARLLLKQAMARAPGDPRYPYRLGLSYARDPAAGSVDQAGAAFDAALQRDPGFVPALLQLGLLYQRHGRSNEAARHFLKAVEIAPTDPEAHGHLAEVLFGLKETAEAHRHRGLSYGLSDQPARAVADYARFQALRPDSVDAALLLSQGYVQMQQNERAAAVVEKALQRHPRHAALRERLAGLNLLTQSWKEATEVCRRWLEDDPNAARAHWLLGRIALASRQMDAAIREFETALTHAPDDPELSFALGGALDQPQATSETRSRALTLLRRAVELKPSSAAYRYRLGIALQRSGDHEAARQEFLATLSRDPSHAAAYNALVQVAQALRRSHQVPLWAHAMRRVQDRNRDEKRLRHEAGARPRDPSVYYSLAQLLLQSGDVTGAESQLEQALQLRPHWLEAQRLLERVTALRAIL